MSILATFIFIFQAATAASQPQLASEGANLKWLQNYEQKSEWWTVGRDTRGKLDYLMLEEMPTVKIDDSVLRDISTFERLSDLTLRFHSQVFSMDVWRKCLKSCPITRLEIGSDARLDPDFFRSIAELSHVQMLVLSNCSGVTTETVGPVLKLTTLTTLNVAGTDVDSTLVDAVNRSRVIEDLVLTNTKIDDRFLEQLRPDLPLKYLSLSNTRVSGGGVAQLAQLKNLLYIRCSCKLRREDLQVLASTHLRRVCMGWSEEGIRDALVVSRDHPSIKLQVGNSTITAGEIEKN